MTRITSEMRQSIIAEVIGGDPAAAVARRYGVSDDTVLRLRDGHREANPCGRWPALRADAFEDDPRACRPMPGRVIMGLRRVA